MYWTLSEVNMALIFRLSSLLVLPFWALMILLPNWRWTARIMRSPFVSVAPAALYVVLALPHLGEIWPVVARPTLAKVATLLNSPAGATIAWIHFLAFDLFVARWIYLDNQRRIRSWVMAPVLFLTLMLGPTGFLLYLGIRSLVNTTNRERRAGLHLEAETTQKSLPAPARIARAVTENIRTLVHTAFKLNRPLTILGLIMLLILAATRVGLLLDHRVITGAPAWLKPAKFAFSISIYCFTFAWLLRFIENHRRLVRLAANVTVISVAVEMIAISIQAARGTTSHFNVSTPFNSFVWTTMGTVILLVWAVNLVLAIMLIRQRMPDRAFAWSLRLGVLVSFIGMAVAFLMVRPTPAQAATFANHAPHIVGAHSVGVPDGGPGLPIVGWSTVGGDLRIAHFVGIHALQVLPFLGWLLAQRKNRFVPFDERHRLGIVLTSGLTYLGFVLLLVWQALRGQSVIHPDAKTLLAASALTTSAAISLLIIIAHALKINNATRGFWTRFIAKDSDHSVSETQLV
jgi:hypothetical protein